MKNSLPVRLSSTRAVLGIPLSRCPIRSVLCAGIVLALACTAQLVRGDSAKAIRHLTDAHTRIVWVRAKESSDVFALGNTLAIVVIDTEDGKGERTIVSGESNCSKPLITPLGNRIVFSNRQTGKALIVNWDGSNQRELADGFALDVWRDPNSGIEWVYSGSDTDNDKGESFRVVHRFQIDKPSVRELVWSKTPAGRDNFQLSRDGSMACGLFPWPAGGVALLPEKEWKPVGNGCWTSLSPDNSYLFWIFDGAHRNVTIFRTETGESWKVPISKAPDIGGYEVYHPRWSNHVRFMVMTGPYKVGAGEANRIRGGGNEVNVYIGRFSPDFRTVERWVRVTSDNMADFYPDAWIDGGDSVSAGQLQTGQKRAMTGNPERFTIRGKLIAKTETPDPNAIAPYQNALGVYTYEAVEPVDRVKKGDRFLVAHWIIMGRQKVTPGPTEAGKVYSMEVERMSDRPDLEGERMIMDTDEVDVPMFFETAAPPKRN